MPKLVISGCNADMISKAEEVINSFLNGFGHSIYAINPDGSIFTLEPGCTLLTVERFHIEYSVEV